MRHLFFSEIKISITLVLLVVGGVFSPGVASENDNAEYFLKIYRGIDLYSKIYKEIAVNYVDTLDPEECMRAGIDGMLKSLDPYTIYISEKEGDEIDLITTGKYGGIGVTIGQRDGSITIISMVEGLVAAKQGMEVGDRIVEVDGKNVQGKSIESVRQLVRGAPGTELKLRVEREGEKKPLEFVLIREEIILKNIAFTGYVSEGVGYIRLERFSRAAGDDIRQAILELRSTGNLHSLILDLRDNPGGLLESAVDVVSKFVPKESLIVTTRGRKIESERKYTSLEIPMEQAIPLVVLVNRMSASASEIVSGAIQDLDRGVIIGTRTFGKGLVQTVIPVSENSKLKMTTARYYTPSGRCIQEIDYVHRDSAGNGSTIPDSSKHEFRTAHNRPVWERGGIYPDSVVTDSLHSSFFNELNRKSMFFKYANQYASKNKVLPDNFKITKEQLEDFQGFLHEKGFEFHEDAEEKVQEMRTLAAKGRYGKSILDEINKLETLINQDKVNQMYRYQDEIAAGLATEIYGHLKGEKARIESTFSLDRQLQTAIGILKNNKAYQSLLKAKGH